MFNRSRTRYEYDPTAASWMSHLVHFRRDAGPGLCPGPVESQIDSFHNVLYPIRYSRGTIEDYVVLPKVKHRFRRRNVFGNLPMAVKPVHHTKVSIDKFKDVSGPTPNQSDTTFVQNLDTSDLLCLEERTITQTCPPLAFLCNRFGTEFVRTQILDSLPSSSPEVSFATVEWSALADQFDESCKALIPSNFLAGEAIYEYGIYKDAFRLVTNPSRAIVGFIKNVHKRGLHRMSLGAINLYYQRLFDKKKRLSRNDIDTAHDLGLIKFGVKEGVDLHLNYKFGVVPAVHDIQDTLAAHSNVEKRLFYLNQHRGRYVPIRVKKGFPATFSPGTFSSPYLDFGHVLKDAFTVAHIFGQGRVRTDINEASRWRAYLEYFGINKAIGLAWELIPFSFVVDWFTNQQELINKLTRIPLGESPFFNLTSIGHSWKNIALYDYVMQSGYDLTNGYPNMEPDGQFPCFSYAVTDYTRLPGFPDTPWFANPSNLGLFHSITGGELLIQKFI